jgi:pimeloyl-ACP methyl ester carboxylesterase
VSLVRHRAGRGDPIVLIHGVASSWRDWKPVIPLLEERFEVVALALPGHYEAPDLAPGVAATVPALVDALEDEIDRLGIAPPHLAGNSMGGWIALELARRGRARSVAALAPAGLSTPEEARALGVAVRRNHRLARVLAPLAPAVARSHLLASCALAGTVRERRRIDPEEAAYKLKAFARCPRFDELVADLCSRAALGLERIACPVLVVWGDADRRLPVEQARRFVDAIPGARLAMLPGSGHLPMWDAPEAVARLLGELAGAAAPRPAAASR